MTSQRLSARLECVFLRGITQYVKEGLACRVGPTVVSQPDVTQYYVDGRLVKSMAPGELCVAVWPKTAVDIPFVTNTVLLSSTQPQPP